MITYQAPMVTVHRHQGIRIIIWAPDHIPPHVHVKSPEGGAVVDLGALTIKADTRKARAAAQSVLPWIREHRAMLTALFKELNP